MNKTKKRKEEHVTIALKEEVSAHHNFWDDIRLIHNALPEINKEDIDLSINLFGKNLGAPLIMAGMTGGYQGAMKINRNLATAAERFQIGMGVGSQRSALEDKKLEKTYSVVKDFDIPLVIANIGASQLVKWGYNKSKERLVEIVDMINADAIAICLNFLQEVIQPEGEATARGCYDAIKDLSDELSVPIVIKETGGGISYEVAKRLIRTNIAGIDVGGAGGTSFAAIEHYRAKTVGDKIRERCGNTFWDWGIPTPISLMEVKRAVKNKIPVIATGGIRSGLDTAKALVLGADAAGMARVLLKPAFNGKDNIVEEIEIMLEELKSAMFLLGAGTVKELYSAGVEIWI